MESTTSRQPGRCAMQLSSKSLDGSIQHGLATETVLSGFRKAGITGSDAESDDSLAEEETALLLPSELAELFRSETEDEEFSGFSDVE